MTRNAAYLLSILLAFSLGFPCGLAFADEGAAKTAYELQVEIETRQAALAQAKAEVDEANAAIEADQKRIEELEREIPQQQKRSAAAARELYKFQQQSVGIVDLLLSAGSLRDFLAELEYVSKISDANVDEMNRLAKMKDEVVAAQNAMKEKRAEADARAEDARAAMIEAQAAQAEVQRRIEEEARMQAQIAAQAAALAAEGRDNDGGAPADPETGVVSQPDVEAGNAADGSGSNEGAEEGGEGAGSGAEAGTPAADAGDGGAEAAPSTDAYAGESDYVAQWAKRIDAYLAGSPLAGQGVTFARAAYQYGVDPRFSPAISFTESGKGQYCFRSHNAWGWGSVSWGSWEEAINDHVAGLARGYGGQISVEGAKKYCPPNWQAWYDRTLGQMQLI